MLHLFAFIIPSETSITLIDDSHSCNALAVVALNIHSRTSHLYNMLHGSLVYIINTVSACILTHKEAIVHLNANVSLLVSRLYRVHNGRCGRYVPHWFVCC